MDVADARFGPLITDRDQLALENQRLFKAFLEEFTDDYATSKLNESSRMQVDGDNDNVSLDSFASAHSNSRTTSGIETSASGGDKTQPKPTPKYSAEVLQLRSVTRNTLFVDFKDVEVYDSNLADDIIRQYYRFYPYLCRALAAFFRDERTREVEESFDSTKTEAQKQAILKDLRDEFESPAFKNKGFYLGFYNLAARDNIRELTSTKIGVMTRVTGQVVRTHTVHPELIIGCFRCSDCLTDQLTGQQFRYEPPKICANENCNNRSRFELRLSESKLTDLQRLRIQEPQHELPRGCVPRSFDVIVRGADLVECIQPGDMCDFVGCLVAVPDVGQIMSGAFGTVTNEMVAPGVGVTGLKSLGVREMNHKLSFIANACILEGQTKPVFNSGENERDILDDGIEETDFTKEEIEKIQKMSQDEHLLDHLGQSLFSSVYGSDDVKKGIILQLLGGVPKRTATGTKLRGDINICLVGDPSTAKSQMLKIVADFAPIKAVYASGKGSSASGLTAAVVRDDGGGFVIEAGALMLADRGICCIDEFDKMDLKDQVAIHEAMEQQTISITKAGVSATLNARASILAAANPIGGCYDPTRDLRSNLNFSLPIMSRFDLFFIVIDPHLEENDRSIASRILDMHMTHADPKANLNNMVYTFEEVKLYIRFARKYYPRIPAGLEEHFAREYLRLRSESKGSKKTWRVTVRQLESLVRLSEAIARAHCREEVRPEYIRMAGDLIQKTIVTGGREDVELNLDLSAPMDDVLELEEKMESQGMYPGELESQRLDQSQKPTKILSVKVPFALFKGIAEVLIARLRKEEEEFGYSEDKESPAMRRSELVDWYLHKCVNEINTERELIEKKQLCEKVIDRLIKKDRALIELFDDGSIIDRDVPTGGEEEDRLIMIEPTLDDKQFFENFV